MDKEEVVAAIGKPEHKVRERDAEGNDIEDWIYGQPPSKTVFIRFQGDKVTIFSRSIPSNSALDDAILELGTVMLLWAAVVGYAP